jgi:hypothetical protein
MKDTHTTFLCGIGVANLCGIGVVALLIAFVPRTFTQAKDALEQCEKSLPKDQKCVIIAIPEDKK